MTQPKETGPRKHRKFTGYHATWMLVAFFGVIVAVNFTMARFALSTFGGTVVDNSYVASQKYNEWLAAARAQDSYGWEIGKPARAGNRLRLTIADKTGAPLTGAQIAVLADHPVGRTEPFTLTMQESAAGTYESSGALPKGRWKLKMRIVQAGREYNMLSEIR